MNVETGETYGGFWAIVAADLSVNDRLHPSGQDSTTVNETVIRSYVCGERETNHLIVNFPTNETANANENADYYFDKKTGMLVELRDETSYVNPNRTIIISWKIRDSNVWTDQSSRHSSFCPYS